MCRFRVRATHTSRRGFSRQHRITQFVSVPSVLGLSEPRIYLRLALLPWTRTTIAGLGYLPASPLLMRLSTTELGRELHRISPKRSSALRTWHHHVRYGR